MAQSKVLSGMMWASFQRFGGLAISFISNMILARLLTPDDFGTIGMLMFFLALAQTFVDSGFGSALIQKKDINETDKSTVFYINMGLSLFMYGILFFCAPIIANYYNIAILTSLLRVLGLTVLIQGVTLIQSTLMMKSMDFKTLSICNISGSIVIALVGIGTALIGCGVWSLVYRSIAGTVVTSLLLWSFNRWRPVLKFSWQSFSKLFNFGGFMLLSSVLITISNNIHTMIMGKLFTPATLGNFTQARTLRNLPSESISSIISSVLYPDFSQYQDNDKIIESKLIRGVYTLSYLMAAAMMFCFAAARPLIQLLYGGQWDAAIPIFQVLCLAGVPLCLQDINISVIKAKGRSKLLFVCNLAKVIIYCILMVVGAKLWGLPGFLAVMVFYTYLAYLVFAFFASQSIGVSIKSQLLAICKSIIYSVVPLLIVMFVKDYINTDCLLAESAIIAIVYFVLFVAISYATNAAPLFFIIDIAKSRRK